MFYHKPELYYAKIYIIEVLYYMNEVDLSDKSWGIPFTCRVAALIISNNNFLVAKNDNHPMYYTIGGAIKVHESSEDAIIREVFEELGIHLEVDRLVFIQERFFEVKSKKHHEIVFFYLMKNAPNMCVTDFLKTDNPYETMRWLPLNGLENYEIIPQFLKSKCLNNITSLEHIISFDY